MGKQKTQVQLPESKLLKAMAELKDVVAKGDVLEEQDPEGGLSTEGQPLSGAARGSKGETKKSRAASVESEVEKSDDESSSDDGDDDESEISKMMSCSGGDDASSDAPPPFAKKKDKGKTKKSVRKAAASSSSSSDDESSDDDSSTSKSFRDQVDGDETVAKAIEISPFLESLVDNFSVAMKRLTASFNKSIADLESRLGARIDNRVAKSVAVQHDFNGRMAKAITAIGESVQGDVVDMIKSLSNSPAPVARGKALLSKSEVNQPPWAGAQGGDNRMANGSDGDGNYLEEMSELTSDAIGQWLFNKSCKSEIDPKLILAWEADRYNPEALPVQVRKALVQDLCK